MAPDNDDNPFCGPPFEGVAVQLVPEWRAFRRGGDGGDCDGPGDEVPRVTLNGACPVLIDGEGLSLIVGVGDEPHHSYVPLSIADIEGLQHQFARYVSGRLKVRASVAAGVPLELAQVRR